VSPQLFLLRWLRLLFCREFHIDDTVALWTCIFADATSPAVPALTPYARAKKQDAEGVAIAEAASQALPLVDYFALAMIEYLRSQLLVSDESGCLQRLMKFPPVENVFTLVSMAKKLREGKWMIEESPKSGASSTSPVPVPEQQSQTQAAPVPAVRVPAAPVPAAPVQASPATAAPLDPSRHSLLLRLGRLHLRLA